MCTFSIFLCADFVHRENQKSINFPTLDSNYQFIFLTISQIWAPSHPQKRAESRTEFLSKYDRVFLMVLQNYDQTTIRFCEFKLKTTTKLRPNYDMFFIERKSFHIYSLISFYQMSLYMLPSVACAMCVLENVYIYNYISFYFYVYMYI